MDFIFDCFFEDTFEKITRNGLQDRSSRRDVLDHLNAVIGGCSEGQNVHTEEVAKLAVLAAIRYHREKKDKNCDVCLMGKFHNILYIALRTCWDWGVRDSAVVVQLLEEIYSCEKTFERIFLGALFGPHAPHFIAGWRSDFRDQDENTRAMVYFLHHATNLDMTLPVWIARYEEERRLKFVDIPIESCGRSSPLRVALQASAPDLLLILLRYGADPNPPDGGASVILSLLEKLIENGRHYVYQNVACLQILLKTLPIIEMPGKLKDFGLRREIFLEKFGSLLVDKIIRKEQVFGVMSLRHLCRCRIRELLRCNGQLPDGIDTLRLPKRLQRYVDLMEEIEGAERNSGDKETDTGSHSQANRSSSTKGPGMQASGDKKPMLKSIEEESIDNQNEEQETEDDDEVAGRSKSEAESCKPPPAELNEEANEEFKYEDNMEDLEEFLNDPYDGNSDDFEHSAEESKEDSNDSQETAKPTEKPEQSRSPEPKETDKETKEPVKEEEPNQSTAAPSHGASRELEEQKEEKEQKSFVIYDKPMRL